jgi:hypothetical protein
MMFRILPPRLSSGTSCSARVMFVQSTRLSPPIADALLEREFEIDFAYCAKEFLVDRTLPHFDSARVAPDRSDFLARHRDSIDDEAVEQILMNRICRLDDNYAYSAGERWVAHECDAEIGIELSSVTFAEADDIGRFPRGQDVLEDRRISVLAQRAMRGNG